MDYSNYMVEQAKNILAIDSPSGFTKEVAEYVVSEYKSMGYEPIVTVKGGIIVDLGGKSSDNSILLEAHIDTLGAVVQEIKSNGRLMLSAIGGIQPHNTEGENCKIYTRFSGVYDGTFQLNNPSVHVNGDYTTKPRDYDNMEVVIDEQVTTKDETKALGIMAGDYICFDPRTTITEKGFIKSRFLDDKLSVGILLGFAKYLKDNKITTERHIYQHITVFEEVGHGGSASVPSDVKEIISVDMGCVGDGLTCRETQVSICPKDSRGPYNYDVTTGLIKAAMDNKV
ncbi:MAG: M42 family metallopeptidase, partial [Oscillospiraceae bacterium]